MHVKHFADFVWNDLDSDLIVIYKDANGAAIDFTGATNITLVCERLDGTDPFTITGEASGDPTEGMIRFGALAQGPAQPKVREQVVYRAVPKWKVLGNSDYTWSQTEYRFTVTRYPSA